MLVLTFKKLALLLYAYNYNIQNLSQKLSVFVCYLKFVVTSFGSEGAQMKNPQWKRAAFLWDVKRQKMKKNKNRGGNTATAARPH